MVVDASPREEREKKMKKMFRPCLTFDIPGRELVRGPSRWVQLRELHEIVLLDACLFVFCVCGCGSTVTSSGGTVRGRGRCDSNFLLVVDKTVTDERDERRIGQVGGWMLEKLHDRKAKPSSRRACFQAGAAGARVEDSLFVVDGRHGVESMCLSKRC